ncbi:TrmH family RNA methyltransferase [Prosthecomicrobium sp. N25]|uniref:TrmH family RNA methyltransferase n=1 Tax=Prosthecomicrobium sp. N25 TaxID=3129254 RepID=UPI0030773D02
MTPIRIDDPDDPRIAAFRDIRERDMVGREGLFVAEGEVVLRVLARAAEVEPVSVLIAENRAAGLRDVLEALDGVPVHVAPQPVLERIAGFPLHRGILALGRRRATHEGGALLAGLSGPAVVLVLCGIANHDNMGGIFRNAAAFGAAAVLVDADCCDPLYRKAIRVSVGGALLVPTARLGRGQDPLALVEAAGFRAAALSPGGETDVADWRPPARVALFLGAEGPGLAPDLMARMTTLRIPMAGGFDSLNVATTSGIVLHHATRRRA